ncbi:hypothetical protein LCGC14_0937130 [marine sediment metagenome]|uniref:Uncharacterized protein n=1 Tax=marine sediment metagenome TaxID=412755 RepID=A0A0F9R4V0_9ZZZZ
MVRMYIKGKDQYFDFRYSSIFKIYFLGWIGWIGITIISILVISYLMVLFGY